MILRVAAVAACAVLSTSAFASGKKKIPTHCTSGEREVFSCPIQKSPKVVSLCRVGRNLFYRYGKPGQKAEFTYPSAPVAAATAFSYDSAHEPSNAHHAGSTIREFIFEHEGTSYTINASTPDDEDVIPTIHLIRDRKNYSSKLNQHWTCSAVRDDWAAIDDLSLPAPRY